MNDTRVKRYIDEIADHDVSDTIDLWPSVRQQIEASKGGLNPYRQVRHTSLIFAGALLAVLLCGVLLIPSARASAQEFIRHFTQTIGNVIEVNFITGSPSENERAIQTNVIASSIDDASARTGFHVRKPEALPDDFALETILAIDGSPYSTLFYRRGDRLGLIKITQYTPSVASEIVTACAIVETSQEAEVDDSGNVSQTESQGNYSIAASENCGRYNEVGAGAEVLTVQVGNVTGEYVAGGWVFSTEPGSLAESEPGNTVAYAREWDSTSPAHQLHWQEDGLLFDIEAHGAGLAMEDLISIAESMR